MEEDIKIIEECKIMDDTIPHSEHSKRLRKALKNLIKGYRELEEKNKRYWELYCKERDDKVFNYFPKSKIKEKIEELEEERKKKDEENTIDVFYDQIDITHIIEVLQELLGDE